MDWLLSSPQLYSVFSSLGKQQGDSYIVSPDALNFLEEIHCKLTYEDQTLRTFRRAIGIAENVRVDLIPLLVNAKDPSVIDASIRIIVNLTVPVECLFSVEVMQRTEVGRQTIFEINKLLLSSKEAFTDGKATKSGIDKLLLYLMTCPKRTCWSVTMVQLIAVLYKDQHINTLQKLLNIWFEEAISESSEDNESNTSPPKQGSGDSSPMLTLSDPTSDSSDNGGGRKNDNSDEDTRQASPTEATLQEVCRKGQEYQDAMEATEEQKIENTPEFREPPSPSSLKTKSPHGGNMKLSVGKSTPQKRECPSSQSELSDCGYGTQVEPHESISTSSNDDEGPTKCPVHQKPPTNQRTKQRTVLTEQQRKDIRKKKLVKRSRSNLINMKGLIQHIPTDEDITNILKEFTVDFLLKGYDYLLEIDLENLRSVLSFKIISYIVYEGVSICEQVELNSQHKGNDLKPYLRRMHLVITAIREFLQALESYKNVSDLTEDDTIHLTTLRSKICSSTDLPNLFILLLRRFNPSMHSKQYLLDLIITNHLLLMVLDDRNCSFNLKDHLSQFATVEIMDNYGLILEDFLENGSYVNDCLFTMMHHVGGDLNRVTTLFRPSILKSFTRIWETEYEVIDDWSDLIEYVINKFMNTQQKESLSIAPELNDIASEAIATNAGSWGQEDMNNLYWYYVQSKKADDVVDATYQRNLLQNPSVADSGIDLKDSQECKPSDDIQILKELIIKENKRNILQWLQHVLLECIYAKLMIKEREDPFTPPPSASILRPKRGFIIEPVAYHCISKNKSIPIVPWNSDHSAMMQYHPFVLLLHKLGFHLPADSGSVYPRVPEFWTADLMYNIALKLGSMDKGTLKFEISNDENFQQISGDSLGKDESSKSSSDSINNFSLQVQKSQMGIRYIPDPSSKPSVPNWLQLVMKSKSLSDR
uniref:Timeless N-terminal domain-containing protein n=1 Tax=Megaselia scalaris TaxID=36166 RepID=T1GLZ6_MEGSC